MSGIEKLLGYHLNLVNQTNLVWSNVATTNLQSSAGLWWTLRWLPDSFTLNSSATVKGGLFTLNQDGFLHVTWLGQDHQGHSLPNDNHLPSVSLLTTSHLKVHHNPAEDHRLRSQCQLLQTRYAWLTRFRPKCYPSFYST